MTPDPRATALIGLGYTPHQAAFLALVALHGGYFLRRQYASFLDRIDGAVVTALLKRVLERHHATRATYCRATKVYHLHARPIYDALGLGNSRNRRHAPPAAVTLKLTTLDFVLRRRDATFFATEAEKVTYFTTTCGLSPAVFPARSDSASRPSGSSTNRFFVDKAPIYLILPAPDVHVVYLQGWSRTVLDFVAFLTRYRPLLTALPRTRVEFVTTSPDVIPEVAARWPSLWARSAPPPVAARVRRSELEAHFQDRRHIERGEWQAFEPRDLDRHREDLARFNSPDIDALYRRWCAHGAAALCGLDTAEADRLLAPPPLDTERLPFRYPLFPAPAGHR